MCLAHTDSLTLARTQGLHGEMKGRLIHSPSDFIKHLSFSGPGITRSTWGSTSGGNPHKIPSVTELALWQGETDEKCSDRSAAWCVRRGWVQGKACVVGPMSRSGRVRALQGRPRVRKDCKVSVAKQTQDAERPGRAGSQARLMGGTRGSVTVEECPGEEDGMRAHRWQQVTEEGLGDIARALVVL